jgi:hypothetical protein
MQSQRSDTENGTDLDTLVLAFVVQVQGTWTPEALGTFRAQLSRQGYAPTDGELEAALARSRQYFDRGMAHLFLCMGRPCLHRQKFDASAPALQHAAEAAQLSITPTACQGPCKQAPVATLRVGQRCEMLAQFMRQSDWQAVLHFATRATKAGTLLVPPGEAQPFRFDPVHDRDSVSGPLQKLRFLLGHFQGHGTFADGTPCFQKEAVGTWEVAGRYLALRMGVTYPLSDGHKDTHTALAMIGVHPDTGDITARVYTDGGAMHDYHLEIVDDAVLFADRPEAHHNVPAKRARKILRPTAYGFEECLELDPGSGQFAPYYTVPLHRTTGSPQGSDGR